MPKISWVHVLQLVFTVNCLVLYMLLYETATNPMKRGYESVIVNNGACCGPGRTGDSVIKDFNANLKFLLLPNISSCSSSYGQSDIDVVIVLKSRPLEFCQRRAIRSTWGRQFYRKIVFVIALTPADAMGNVDSNNSAIPGAIIEESQFYGDILLVNFLDTYQHLSLKSYSILRWITEHCPTSSEKLWFVQGDTDTVLVGSNLIQFIRSLGTKEKVIYGKCWENAVVERQGKWAVSRVRYAWAEYPLYCAGAMYLMSHDVPQLLLSALPKTTTYFHIDDALFTGILAEIADVDRISRPDLFCKLERRIFFPFRLNDCNCTHLIGAFEFKSAYQLISVHASIYDFCINSY